jgi:fido (protein-threonine AMPylation protein)
MPTPKDERDSLLTQLHERMFENAFDDAGRLRVVILQPSTPPSTDPATCELQSWLPPQPPPSSKE